MSNDGPNPADAVLDMFGIPTDGPAAKSNPNMRISSSTPYDRYGLNKGGKSHRRKARKAAKKSKRSKRSKRSRKARKSTYY